MKKIYATPSVQMTGSVVQETRDDVGGPLEGAGFQKIAGGVGFNL